MDNDILQQLKKLGRVKPDPDFAKRTRYLILAAPQKRNVPRFALTWGFSFALAALLIAIVAFKPFQATAPTLSRSFNPEKLASELNNLTINVQLEEITYRQTVDQAIASALSEVAEQKKQETALPESSIDRLLDEVIF